jgi:hypothetical protein
VSARETLEGHAEELRQATGLAVDIVEEPGGHRLFTVLRQVLLPSGLFAVVTSDMLFIADKQYPDSALDMFWLEVPVIRANGTIPQGADHLETYLDQPWRRFSWHRNGTWNPGGNGLLDHFAFVEAAWAKEAQR